MKSPIETKVAAPAISVAVLIPLVTALYMLADEFWLDLTDGQVKALSAVGVALIPIIQFLVGYNSPHTPRAVEVDDDGQPIEPGRKAGRTYVNLHSSPGSRRMEETDPT